jgi:hypothetical protein
MRNGYGLFLGGNTMIIKDPKELSKIQDMVFANPAYQPKVDGETFCNTATQDVLRNIGYFALSGFSADGMYKYVSASKDWLIKPMADAQALVNVGTVLISILPSVKLNQDHGHVNTLTPGPGDFSGNWNCKTPVCMNIGRAGTCFRIRGINWAFVPIPEIYALVATL